MSFRDSEAAFRKLATGSEADQALAERWNNHVRAELALGSDHVAARRDQPEFLETYEPVIQATTKRDKAAAIHRHLRRWAPVELEKPVRVNSYEPIDPPSPPLAKAPPRGFSMSESDYHRLRDGYMGICLACREERECTEPDACEYPCEACGEDKVYGIEELLIMGEVSIQ